MPNGNIQVEIDTDKIYETYYKSHRLDDARSDVPANIEFRENIDKAIKIWEEMRRATR